MATTNVGPTELGSAQPAGKKFQLTEAFLTEQTVGQKYSRSELNQYRKAIKYLMWIAIGFTILCTIIYLLSFHETIMEIIEEVEYLAE